MAQGSKWLSIVRVSVRLSTSGPYPGRCTSSSSSQDDVLTCLHDRLPGMPGTGIPLRLRPSPGAQGQAVAQSASTDLPMPASPSSSRQLRALAPDHPREHPTHWLHTNTKPHKHQDRTPLPAQPPARRASSARPRQTLRQPHERAARAVPSWPSAAAGLPGTVAPCRRVCPV
jgi:hypothetical protein